MKKKCPRMPRIYGWKSSGIGGVFLGSSWESLKGLKKLGKNIATLKNHSTSYSSGPP